jgi:hypothetical protein
MTEEPIDGSAYIHRQLESVMVTGRYSSLLVTELMQCVEGSSANIFPILNEIGGLEGAPHTQPRRTKAAAQFERPPLSGLWHKHYPQAGNIPENVILHWKPKMNSKILEDHFQAIMQDQDMPLEEKSAALSRAVVDGYWERGESQKITGEWIVYARHQDVNCYLTLGMHGEDDAIRKRVLSCCNEFPHLDICK